jgi:diguanylate cyclase (GGDEF)-like protein
MQLDFETLYVVILLNSLSLIVVWTAIVSVYRSFIAARYWLGALIASAIGGVLLALDAAGDMPFVTYAGMATIAGGFGVMWLGVRVFYEKPPLWSVVALIVAGSLVVMVLTPPERAAQNVVYAVSQMVPIALAMIALLIARPRQLGALVAAGAAALALVGHGAETTTNLLRLAGLMSTERYYDFAAWFLVATIIGGSVWNLGFLLMAIDRLRTDLAVLATRDDLTGLPNRRGLREKVRLCEKSVRRKNSSAVLMMIDLDRFKSINDRFGHAAGDACLVHVVAIARSLMREDDVLARLSGDEFCVLLPHTDVDTAAGIAEKLTDTVSATPLEWKGRTIAMSVSIGLCGWTPKSAVTLNDALERADRALYGTKAQGRNGYTIYRDDWALAS